MSQDSDITLDSLLQNMTSVLAGSSETVKTEPVTFWLPEGTKAKFDLIQGKTNRKFSRVLKEIIKKSIDKIDVDKL